MSFIIDEKIFATFPTATLGVVILDGIDNSKPSTFAAMLNETCAKAYEQLGPTADMATHPAIAPWREAYAKFGAKPNKFRSSIEALLRRVQKNSPLPSISPLVDLYNALSVKYALPCGAEDLNSIEGDLHLKFATGTERGMCLGESEPSTCELGEVAYLDNTGFVCRRWNWREADRTKITPQTAKAIFVTEALTSEGAKAVSALLEEFVAFARKELGGIYKTAIMNSNNRRIDF